MSLLVACAFAVLPAAPSSGEATTLALEVPTEWAVSMGSRLVAGADGGTYVSWVEQKDKRARLRYAKLGGDGWGAAHTVAEGSGWMVNWADYPVLAIEADGSMAASWLERTEALPAALR